MNQSRKAYSKPELTETFLARIAGIGKQKFVRYVWISTTVCLWLVANFSVMQKITIVYTESKALTVVAAWGVASLAICVFIGYVWARCLWQLFVTRSMKGTRPK